MYERVDRESHNIEPGKCYYSLYDRTSDGTAPQEKFILEFIRPEYELKTVSHSLKELQAKYPDQTSYQLRVADAALKFVSYSKDLDFLLKKDEQFVVNYCLVEEPGRYKTYKESDFINGQIDISVNSLAERSHIKKTLVKKKPRKLQENQYYYEGYNGSLFKVVNGNGGSGTGSALITSLKKRLIELGYKLEMSNKLDDLTKKAVIDFQTKNNIPVGQLDYDTLKLLGIQR